MKFFAVVFFVSALSSATPFNPKPFDQVLQRRQATAAGNASSTLVIDLGYSMYEGFYNDTNNVNEWIGIRYAAPPIGSLRWQAPQAPLVNRSSILNASAIPNQCPQSQSNVLNQTESIALINTNAGSEDCLYLSVYSPPNSQNLPVLVWVSQI